MATGEQDHVGVDDVRSNGTQRPMKRKALSIAIRYNDLSERMEDKRLLLKNTNKDLEIVREILTSTSSR